MNKDEILKLVDKYLAGNATEQEIQLLHEYYDGFQHSGEWNEAELGNREELEQKMLHALEEKIHVKRLSFITRFYRTRFGAVAAAAILIVAGTGLWMMLKNHQPQQAVIANNKKTEPFTDFSGSKAILTLANGKRISLDSAMNGVIANEANSTIQKQNGQIVYETGNTAGAVATAYNTITTQKGGEYLIVLSDGTKVWLNAASALRFPPAFTGNQRQVEIKGEAYFEVAKNPLKPFRVSIIADNGKSKGVVEVLGTHFNINSYDEETAVKTTLLEGSVKITPVLNGTPAPGNTKMLVPGQQAQINNSANASMKIEEVDVDEVMAWKNGLFNFNNADIKTIMRQVARWYDVEVVYEEDIPSRIFSGKIKRSADISNVLAILEQSDIHFTLQDKRIVVKR